MEPQRLVTMANQIAHAFRLKGEERAIAETADHIQKFWDPRMRREIRAILEAGGDGLEPIARKAVEQITVS
jgi:formate dehydrogenase subunit delta